MSSIIIAPGLATQNRRITCICLEIIQCPLVVCHAYVQVQKTEYNTEGVITGGTASDNPRGTIIGGSTNGNTATKGNTGGATEISPV